MTGLGASKTRRYATRLDDVRDADLLDDVKFADGDARDGFTFDDLANRGSRNA